MSAVAAGSAVYGLGKTLGINFGDILGGIGGIFGMSHQEKCDAVKKSIRTLWQAGVPKTVLKMKGMWPCDHWKSSWDFEKIFKAAPNDQLAVQYITENMPAEITMPKTKAMVRNFDGWLARKKQSLENANRKPDSTGGTGSTGGGTGTKAGTDQSMWVKIGVALAAVFMLFSLVNQGT